MEHAEDAEPTQWDTGGASFIVDNSATCIICNDRSMFIGDLKRSDSDVITTNSTNTPPMEGTIRLTLRDDAGVGYTYEIPGTLYNPR